MIETGLTVLLREKPHLIEEKNIGLITNQTGVDEDLRSNVSLFAACPKTRLTALFSPEHGLWGNHQDMLKVPSASDEHLLIPIHSLYGDTLQPTQEMLKGIDVLVYDIQNVGARYYTFITTMLLSMRAACENDVEFIVLDRPNPIGGNRFEGTLLQQDYISFVGAHPIPIRHGMTIGELALLFKAELRLDLQLEVVPMRGWRRNLWYDQTGLPWVPSSPSMPTLDTAILYPGTCLIEGTNLSEGRGTTKPFEWIGAPWLDADGWSETMNDLGILGVRFRPVHFVPSISKYSDELCHGVGVHVMDRERAMPFEIVLHLLATVIESYPSRFEFSVADGTHFVDLLAGTDSLRRALIARQSPADILQSWRNDLDEFARRRKPFLIYA
ncbi:MAG: DUF1343 domain-containing protein [Candidatus Poribacteria bacterium]|nr:DUF1343 domain-containing protein [Candidatus Poribacteria bacterium]MDE0505724.1 DUF1343 domain-containing protein [Candidatus Poribacteria bacterium]